MCPPTSCPQTFLCVLRPRWWSARRHNHSSQFHFTNGASVFKLRRHLPSIHTKSRSNVMKRHDEWRRSVDLFPSHSFALWRFHLSYHVMSHSARPRRCMQKSTLHFLLLGFFLLLLLSSINTAAACRVHTTAALRSALRGEHFLSLLKVKMRSLLLVVLCATLRLASSDSQPNIETLMDNVVVVWVPHRSGSIVSVRLTCGEAFQNQPVIWKKDGMELQPPLSGNQVTVQVEEMNGGNFTCHLGSNGEYLNHTVVLVQLESDNRTVILEEKSPEEGAIRCTAPNYDGSFHCSWTRTPSRSKAAVLLVKAERNMEKILCELDADGSGVRCQDANCSRPEEPHRISLSVYIHSYSRLEVYTRTFYLRDIAKPEKLPNLHMSRGKVFSWDYPSSWSKPCSFFALQFEVKVVHHGEPCTSEPIMSNFTSDNKYEVTVKTKKYVFCVRAQDKYTKGLWSHWSKCTVNKDTLTC